MLSYTYYSTADAMRVTSDIVSSETADDIEPCCMAVLFFEKLEHMPYYRRFTDDNSTPPGQLNILPAFL